MGKSDAKPVKPVIDYRPTECAECGEPIRQSGGNCRLYCAGCRMVRQLAAKNKRPVVDHRPNTCAECGDRIRQKSTGVRLYCGPCAADRHRRAAALREQNLREDNPWWLRDANDEKKLSPRKRREEYKKCPKCGELFHVTSKDRRGAYCSEPCRKSAQRHHAEQRWLSQTEEYRQTHNIQPYYAPSDLQRASGAKFERIATAVAGGMAKVNVGRGEE
jgi:predicted RNA-binding Zn-ribbon protein involved in translation (DUF1610 family)